MECKDEAAVERQKLVPDDEIENDPDDEQSGLPSAPGITKTQTPISPVLSSKVSVFFYYKWPYCVQVSIVNKSKGFLKW